MDVDKRTKTKSGITITFNIGSSHLEAIYTPDVHLYAFFARPNFSCSSTLYSFIIQYKYRPVGFSSLVLLFSPKPSILRIFVGFFFFVLLHKRNLVILEYRWENISANQAAPVCHMFECMDNG